MTRRKLAKREELLKYKVGVRFDQKTYNKLKTWVEQTNTSSVGELVRRIITKEKVTFYVRDISRKQANTRLTVSYYRAEWLIDFVCDRSNKLAHTHHARSLRELGSSFLQIVLNPSPRSYIVICLQDC